MTDVSPVPGEQPPEPGQAAAAACDAAMLEALLGQAPTGFAFIDTAFRLRREIGRAHV